MSSFFGQYLRLSLFGQSHGAAIGITVDGLPAGLKIDFAQIRAEMARRAPGNSPLATSRAEADEVEILSGIKNDTLTGQPLCAVIRNTNQQSKDYPDEMVSPRPGHADYTGHVRYYGFEDFRGGGHFSGRLTAPIVFAGAVCKQFLADKGIAISAEMLLDEKAILKAKAEHDSVGGDIRCVVSGVPVGLGAPFFDPVESVLSHLLFSVPGVKGVFFGDSVHCLGSEYNDAFCVRNGKVTTATNHAGGIQGGVTNGAEVVFTCSLRPTASIGKAQTTVSLKAFEQMPITVSGRHDPCILPRAVPVIEAMAAIAFTELWKERLQCPL